MQEDLKSRLIQTAVEAKEQAIAPYSHFRVGAALSSGSGEIYRGCNIEVSSYSMTICAERVAIFKALSEGERKFDLMAVAAGTESFCPPCGACRQVLIDFAPDIRIVMINSRGELKETTIQALMPEAFNPSYLSG